MNAMLIFIISGWLQGPIMVHHQDAQDIFYGCNGFTGYSFAEIHSSDPNTTVTVYHIKGDLTGDGITNLKDFAIVARYWIPEKPKKQADPNIIQAAKTAAEWICDGSILP